MNVNSMIKVLRAHPDSDKIGMITCHLGVVRGTSRNGQKVTAIEVKYDHGIISDIILETKKMPGIVEVMVDTNEGKLEVGDEILAVVVGGNIRENVFPALIETVNRIKANASKKQEIYVG